MANQTFKKFEDESISADVNKVRDETMEKIKFRDQKLVFDETIKELASKAAEFYEKYGEEDWRTSLLVNFLDLSLQMQDIIEVVTAFNVANEIIFQAIGLMNTSLKMSNGMMLEMGTQTIKPFKQKMMLRKAVRNNKNTVKNMIRQMKVSIDMAAITAGMYEGLSESISGIMEKMNAKRIKRRSSKKKKVGIESTNAASGRGMNMVKSILNGGAGENTEQFTPSSPSNASTGDSGLDGLI